MILPPARSFLVLHGRVAAALLWGALLPSGVLAQDAEAGLKRTELVRKYVAALEGLEKRLAESGDIDAIVHVKEEREAVAKSGETTSHQDKALVDLRAKYLKSLVAIGGVTPAPATVVPVVEGLKPIKVPAEKPPYFEKPFAMKDRWLESLTVPVGKQKIREPVVIGDRVKKKWPHVVVLPGSVWSGSDRGRVELSAAKLVASQCRFEKLPLEADLASDFYFLNCAFDGCLFRKGGGWYGWEQAGKFYFENCHIKGSFSDRINVVDTGFRAHTSVFEGVEFPPMLFLKKQPADYLKHEWLRLVHCRFVKCKIPVSFLLLTRDCLFENCVFTDDPPPPVGEAEITTPIEIVLYVKGCKSRISGLPASVSLLEKPDTDLTGVAIPTAAALTEMMNR